jgi:hypothetical protein
MQKDLVGYTKKQEYRGMTVEFNGAETRFKVINSTGMCEEFSSMRDALDYIDYWDDSHPPLGDREFTACTTEPGAQWNKNVEFNTERELFEFVMKLKDGFGWGEVWIDGDRAREYFPGGRVRNF